MKHQGKIKDMLQKLYEQPAEDASAHLKRWYFWATHSRLTPIIKAAKTIKAHWDGVMRWFESGLNNGFMEGINSLVQAAKARAGGYRSTKKMKVMIYLIAGKLNFDLPRVMPSMLPILNSEEAIFYNVYPMHAE